MNIVCVIPARYKSSRFPGKPLADICGKPMIWWVYEQCKKVKEFSKVIVATDDERIAEVCEALNLCVEMTSDIHLTGTDRVTEVASRIPADLYVNVQGDEPLVQPDAIRQVFQPFLSTNCKVQVSNLMTPITDPVEVSNSTVVKTITRADGIGLYLTRAAAPYPKGTSSYRYYKQLGIYAFTKKALDFFAEYGRTYGKSKNEMIEDVEMLRFIENDWQVQFIEVEEASVAVDTMSDLEKVVAIIKQQNNERQGELL